MNREEKIKAIYKEIADKDLSFWCKLLLKNDLDWWHIFFEKWADFFCVKCDKDIKILYKNWFTWPLHFTDFEFENFEILGHPVMIWDVLESLYWDVRFSDFAWIWKELRLPIEKQSDECIDFIYNLIKE